MMINSLQSFQKNNISFKGNNMAPVRKAANYAAETTAAMGKVVIPSELEKTFPKINPLKDYDVLITKHPEPSEAYKLDIRIPGAEESLDSWTFFDNPESHYDIVELIETFPQLLKRRMSRMMMGCGKTTL